MKFDLVDGLKVAISILSLGNMNSVSEVDKHETPLTGYSLLDVSKVEKLSQKFAFEASYSVAKKLDFESFKATVYKEPFDGGGYIVNGDYYLPDDATLLEFYVRELVATVKRERNNFGAKLVIDGIDNYQRIWEKMYRNSLTYCISNEFGKDHGKVKTAIEAAAGSWQAAGDIDFVYLPAHNNNCNNSNDSVVFDVRPVDVGNEYYARAFFPNYARSARNLMINIHSLLLPVDGNALSLTGIMRHELGHALGARHEHIRPESGTCFKDETYIPVTGYDGYSVMHYPQCNGLAGRTFRLSENDKHGIACVYGPSVGFAWDRSKCLVTNN